MPRRGSSQEDVTSSSADTVQLCLWSLNPAIAFRDLARGAHSLVLTSGTLAPMDTFASEVGSRLDLPHPACRQRTASTSRHLITAPCSAIWRVAATLSGCGMSVGHCSHDLILHVVCSTSF